MTTPVVLVTGFLGAGKTSFINQLLRNAQGIKIAAIVNDFGAINIDEALLSSATDTVIGLRNGCICCSLQGDLLRTLRLVLLATPTPEAIVIEASGVADPRGIVQSVMDPVLWQSIRLEAVVCVVDAQDLQEHAKRSEDPLWRAQTASADYLLLSKTQTLTPEAQQRMQEALRQMWHKPLFSAQDEAMLLSLLLALPSALHQSAGRVGGAMGEMGETGLGPPASDRPRLGEPHTHTDTHTPALGAAVHSSRFAALEWRSAQPISLPAFQQTVQALATGLLRAKGFLQFVEKPNKTYLFQLVGRRATYSPQTPSPSTTGCQLVMIGESGLFSVPEAQTQLAKLTQQR